MRGAWLMLLGASLGCGTASPSALGDAPLGAQQLPAASLRRLSVAELSAAATTLTGADVDLASRLPPDARQHDFSRNLAQALSIKLKRLLDPADPAFGRIEIGHVDGIAYRLYERFFGRRPNMASGVQIDNLIAGAIGELPGGFSKRFVLAEWHLVVDEWQLRTGRPIAMSAGWDGARGSAGVSASVTIPRTRNASIHSRGRIPALHTPNGVSSAAPIDTRSDRR